MDYIDIDELYLVKNKGLKSNASLSMKWKAFFILKIKLINI